MLAYDIIVSLIMAGLGLVVNYVCSKAVKDRYKFEEDKTIIHSFFSDINIAIMFVGVYFMAMASGSLSVSIFEIFNLVFYTVATYIAGVTCFELGRKIFKFFNHHLPKLIRTFNATVDKIISKIVNFRVGNIIGSGSDSSQEIMRLKEQVAELSLQLEERRKLLTASSQTPSRIDTGVKLVTDRPEELATAVTSSGKPSRGRQRKA